MTSAAAVAVTEATKFHISPYGFWEVNQVFISVSEPAGIHGYHYILGKTLFLNSVHFDL